MGGEGGEERVWAGAALSWGDMGWRRLFSMEMSGFPSAELPDLCCILSLISFLSLFSPLHFCNLTKNDAWDVLPINSGLSFPASRFWRLWDVKSAPWLPQNWGLALPCSLGGYMGILFLLIPAPAQPFPGLGVGERPGIPREQLFPPRRSQSQRCDVNVCLHLNSSPPLLVAGK